MRLLLFSICFHCYAYGFSLGSYVPCAKSTALGNTILINSDVFSASNGVAGIMKSKERFALCMSNRFGIPSFTDFHAGLMFGSEHNKFALNYSISPLQQSLNQSISAGFGMRFSERSYLGVGLHYARLKIESELISQQLAGSAGAGLELGLNLVLISNLRFAKYYDRFQISSSFGLQYDISKQARAYLQLNLDPKTHFNWGVGARIYADRLNVLFGYQFKTSTISSGLEITTKSFVMCASLQFHPVLYVSPGLQLSRYEF